MIFYFYTVTQTINTLSVLAACGYALWKGRRPERLASLAVLIAWVVTPLIQDQSNLAHFQWSIFELDAMLFSILFYQALVTKIFWPLWAASFQFLELLMHIAMLIDPKVHGRAYFIGMELWSYLVLLSITIGTRLEAQKLKRT